MLPLFERARPGDNRPRQAIGQARAWARGEITMTQAREAAYAAHSAAREANGAAKEAARAAGHAVAVQILPIIAEALNLHFEGFSDDEIRMLLALLKRMIQNGEHILQQACTPPES